jgi:hypothetical protein
MQMRDKILIRQVEEPAGVLKAVPRCLATLPGREKHIRAQSVFIYVFRDDVQRVLYCDVTGCLKCQR